MKNLYIKFKHLFDPIDLTEGKIVRIISLFLIPIILSAVFTQIYSLTDAVIVGHNLSDNEFAGVNNAVPLTNFFMNFVIGCASGFSVLISRSIGEKNPNKARNSIFISLVLSAAVCVVLIVISICCIDYLLQLVNIYPAGSANPSMQAIYDSAKTYLIINFAIGTASIMFYNMINAILRAMGDSFTPFLFLVASVIINVILDLLFIVVFHWGVAGAACATILSQALATIGAFIYAFVRFPNLRLHKSDTKITWKSAYDHLRLGIPLGFELALLFIGVILMSRLVVPYDMISANEMVAGKPAINGYGVSNKYSSLLMAFLSAPGTAILPFISQNYGAKKFDRIKKGFKITFWISTAISFACMIIGFLGMINNAYIHIFLSQDLISGGCAKFGNGYLFMILPFYPFLGYIFFGRNAIQALEKPMIAFSNGIVELVSRTIILFCLPVLFNNGNPIDASATYASYLALCSADSITWILSALFILIPAFYIIYKKLPNSTNIVLQQREEHRFDATK